LDFGLVGVLSQLAKGAYIFEKKKKGFSRHPIARKPELVLKCVIILLGYWQKEVLFRG